MDGEERWLPIAGYEGRYEVSDRGRVRSNPAGRPSHILKPYAYHSYGCGVDLYRDGVEQRCYIHRLVAEAFIGPPPPGMPDVRHLDHDYSNNHVDNLRWRPSVVDRIQAFRAKGPPQIAIGARFRKTPGAAPLPYHLGGPMNTESLPTRALYCQLADFAEKHLEPPARGAAVARTLRELSMLPVPHPVVSPRLLCGALQRVGTPPEGEDDPALLARRGTCRDLAAMIPTDWTETPEQLRRVAEIWAAMAGRLDAEPADERSDRRRSIAATLRRESSELLAIAVRDEARLPGQA